MAGASPTALTLQECRKRGWPATKVEYWNHAAKRRIDLFGFGDILALDGKPGSLIIQATTKANMSARCNKIERSTEAHAWLQAENRIQVWGWWKRPMKKGSKKLIWAVKFTTIKLDRQVGLLYGPDGKTPLSNMTRHVISMDGATR
jgi:hypothetical protein